MTENITQGDLIVIHWYDALAEASWTEIALIEIKKPPLAKSVGLFLNENEDCVRILSSVCGKEASYEIIPKGMIKNIEKVREDEIAEDW